MHHEGLASSAVRDSAVPGAVRIMQAGEHLLFAVLLLVGALQALVRDLHPVPVLLLSLLLATCYLLATGLVLRRPPGARHLWLLLLTAAWIGARCFRAIRTRTSTSRS